MSGCILSPCLLICRVKVKSLSCVRLFVAPWTVAYQAPLSMGFSRQSAGVDCHFLLQGIFPTQELNPGLPHCRQTLYHLSHQGSPGAEYIMQNAGLVEAQAGIKIARRNISNLRYADDTTLMAQSEEEQNSLLMKVKEESGKADLKLNIQKTKIMASGPITSWQIDRETMETMIDFILGGSKITSGGDCNREIKRQLLLGRKAMTNLDSILKSRHYFSNKGPSSQTMVFQ